MLSTGTCAGQYYVSCAEDPVEDVSLGVNRNSWCRVNVPPAIEAVNTSMVTTFNIDSVSSTLRGFVAQYVGVAGLGTSDVIQELFFLHLLYRQSDGPVIQLSILQQILFPVKILVKLLASSVL